MGNELPTPFRILKSYPKKTWILCDKCAEMKSEIHWSDRCILPIAAGIAVANEMGMNGAEYGYQISALYAWRKYKEIYSFDNDLSDMLFSQADTGMDIPIKILYQMPYPCIYIQYHDSVLDSDTGFFAYFEHDVNNAHKEFRMWVVSNEESYPLILHIEDQCTIGESIDKTVEESRKRATPSMEHLLGLRLDELKQKAAELLQLVLYVCAENSEKEENPDQRKITRRNSASESKPKDVFREIQKWDVGFRIGNQIRHSKQHRTTGEHGHIGSAKSKAPHSRRGHWHHYWIGRRDEQQLVLKWVAPMFINGGDDDTATIHPVKSE